MKTIKGLFVLVLMLQAVSPIYAQFGFQAEIRPRAEYRHGFHTLRQPSDDPAAFVSQRTRLNASFSKSGTTALISMNDARVWGEVPGTSRLAANTSLHEAWVELALNNKVRLKAGRQEIVYDNARIFGNGDWGQTARSHDMVLLKFKPVEGLQMNTGFAFNQESERRTGTPYTLPGYKSMQHAWLHYKTGVTAISMLALNLGAESESGETLYNQTFGGRVIVQAGKATLAGAYYFQTGEDRLGKDIQANYLMIEAGLPLAASWRLGGAFEYVSGTDQPTAGGAPTSVNRSFTPVFGTNHAFNGHMDYFFAGSHMNNVGLINPLIQLHYQAAAFNVQLHLHTFYADGAIANPASPSGKASSFLGNEADLILSYPLNDTALIRAGYSRMFATPSMEILKGGSSELTNQWAWLMLTVKI